MGLSYYDGHKFRGRCVIEFGPPISITSNTLATYRENNRAGCKRLLEQARQSAREGGLGRAGSTAVVVERRAGVGVGCRGG